MAVNVEFTTHCASVVWFTSTGFDELVGSANYRVQLSGLICNSQHVHVSLFTDWSDGFFTLIYDHF